MKLQWCSSPGSDKSERRSVLAFWSSPQPWGFILGLQIKSAQPLAFKSHKDAVPVAFSRIAADAWPSGQSNIKLIGQSKRSEGFGFQPDHTSWHLRLYYQAADDRDLQINTTQLLDI
jgi:hypothetical protein